MMNRVTERDSLSTSDIGSKVLSVILETLKWMFLLVVLVFTLAPLVWVVLSSFKTNGEIFTSTFSLPKEIQVINYRKAFALDGLFLAFRNTVLVAVFSTAFSILMATMASYALTFSFRFKNAMYFFLILGMYVPINAFLVPYFVLVVSMKIYNTLWALIVVYAGIGLPMAILILKGYIDTIPREILEAAIVDGCSFNQTFAQIILPLAIPGMATIAIFQIVAAWNEFLFAMVLTSDKYARTLQISIRYFMGSFVQDWASMFATMVVCLIPTILAYTLFQNQIISGLTSGALKG